MTDAAEVLVHRLMDARLTKGKRVNAAWVTAEIRAHLSPSFRHDDDAGLIFFHEGVRQVVGRCIRKTRGVKVADETNQPLLPGYERLQRIYILHSEDGTEEIVRAVDMTYDDWMAKRDELMAQRDGIDEHVEEINRLLANWPRKRA